MAAGELAQWLLGHKLLPEASYLSWIEIEEM